MQEQVTEPNQRYLKVKHVLNNPDRYNSFIFGNSRVGKIDVGKINDGNQWYNFAYSEGIPFEHLQDIKTLLSGGVSIKKVIVGLDEISCFFSREKHKNESLRRRYVNSLDPFLYYLTLKPSIHIYKEIKKAPSRKFFQKGMFMPIYETGTFLLGQKDTFIDENPTVHIQDSIFRSAYWLPEQDSRNIDPTLEDINELKKMCIEKNIELVLFINPIYVETYKKAVSENFIDFIGKLTTISQFYDFSGINELTTNRLNYYENLHYRPKIGDMIIKEVFDPDSKYLICAKNADYRLSVKIEEARTHNSMYKK